MDPDDFARMIFYDGLGQQQAIANQLAQAAQLQPPPPQPPAAQEAGPAFWQRQWVNPVPPGAFVDVHAEANEAVRNYRARQDVAALRAMEFLLDHLSPAQRDELSTLQTTPPPIWVPAYVQNGRHGEPDGHLNVHLIRAKLDARGTRMREHFVGLQRCVNPYVKINRRFTVKGNVTGHTYWIYAGHHTNIVELCRCCNQPAFWRCSYQLAVPDADLMYSQKMLLEHDETALTSQAFKYLAEAFPLEK